MRHHPSSDHPLLDPSAAADLDAVAGGGQPPEPPAPDADVSEAKPAADQPTGAQLKAEVLRLYAEGVTSASAIAKATGAARTLVRRWLNERQQEAAQLAVAGALMPITTEAAATR